MFNWSPEGQGRKKATEVENVPDGNTPTHKFKNPVLILLNHQDNRSKVILLCTSGGLNGLCFP